MIGEKATTDITISKNSKGLEECKGSAKKGGDIACNTRKEIEKETGNQIVISKNYLHLSSSSPLATNKKLQLKPKPNLK